MNERMVNYKCENCGAIGELNEYYDFLQCPQCQGKMLPMNSLEELMSSDFVPPNLDDDATISISREFIPKAHKGVKVAAAVDIGFGGMLSSSITGKYSSLASSQDKTEKNRFAPPPPPQPAPTHTPHKHHTSTTTKNRPATTGRNKPVSKNKKSFTIHKKKKQSKKHTGSFSPTSTSRSRSVTKTSLRIKPVKKKTTRSSHKQTNSYPTIVAEEESRTLHSGMEQTQQELQIPNEVYNQALPEEENTANSMSEIDNSNLDTSEQIAESTSNNQEVELNIESIVNDINSGKTAKDSNDFIENMPQEQERTQASKPKIATAVGIKPQTKQTESQTPQKTSDAIKPSPTQQDDNAKSAPVNPNNDRKQKTKNSTQMEQASQQSAQKTVAQKQKNGATNPNKKSTLPPPRRKKPTTNKQTKTQNSQQKQGRPQQKNKPNRNNKNNNQSDTRQGAKKQTARKKSNASINNKTDNNKPTSSTQTRNQAQNPNANENNANEASPQMTRTGLIRLQMAKQKQIKMIIGIIMGVVALIVFILTKACVSATSKSKKTKKVRVNANSGVGKFYSQRNASSSYSGGASSRPAVERSDLYKDFMALKRKTKKMPQSSADQIDEIIGVWEQFIDDHASESGDPKYDEALQYIEDLKESKKLYTEGFGL